MELKFVLPPLSAVELARIFAALSVIDDGAVAMGNLDSEYAQVYRKLDTEKQMVSV